MECRKLRVEMVCTICARQRLHDKEEEEEDLFKQAYRMIYEIYIQLELQEKDMPVLGNRSNYFWSIRPCLGS
jgi:hypothetical protein